MLLAVVACLFDYGPASRGLAGPGRKAVTAAGQLLPQGTRWLVDFSMKATCCQDLDLKLCLLIQVKFPALWEAFIGTEENLSLASHSLPPSLKQDRIR